MILVGIGANLPAPGFESPQEGCLAALDAIAAAGLKVVARSGWYRTAPVPISDQPWFVNAVAAIDGGGCSAAEVMAVLHAVERAFGRVRGEPNAAPHAGSRPPRFPRHGRETRRSGRAAAPADGRPRLRAVAADRDRSAMAPSGVGTHGCRADCRLAEGPGDHADRIRMTLAESHRSLLESSIGPYIGQ